MSESLPPIQGPQGEGTIPPRIGYSSGPPPKKSNAGLTVLVAVLGFVFLACAGLIGFGAYRSNHSGVVVNGIELTRSEVKTAEKEIKEMMLAVRPHDLASLNMETTSTNPLTGLVRQYLSGLKTAEVKLVALTSKMDVDGILGHQLGTANGRKKSRTEATAVDKAVYEYSDSQMAALTTFQNKWREAFHLDSSFGSGNVAYAQKLRDQYKGISETRFALLDFADRRLPQSDGKQLLFETDQDINQYNKLIETYNKRFEDYQKTVRDKEQSRTMEFSKAFGGLD